MTRTRAAAAVLTLALFIALRPDPAGAQTSLSLADAMARARVATPQARALDAAEGEAAERVRQARSGYFPRVDVAESIQRGNQPVYVFSSLLSQRRFTADNFAIDALNRPSALTNFRTSIGVDQAVFDGGTTRLAVRGAELGRDAASAMRRETSAALAFGAASAFIEVLRAEAAETIGRAAVEAADSDLQRARARRDAGLATEADVLSVDVHLADARQRQASRAADLAIARLRLSEAIGLPIASALTLERPAQPLAPVSADALVQEALASRADRQVAAIGGEVAAVASRAARAALLPTVGAQAGWEFNGASLADQRGAWVVGTEVRMNLFRGFADASRIAESRLAEARAAAEVERIERAIEVDVRSALARLEAARAGDAAGRAALAQARESQRIIRDRYDSGLATVTDVLRAAEAVVDAESRAVSAELDVVLQAVALDRAAGRL